MEIRESDVSRVIIEGFAKDLLEYTRTDAIIVGSGPAGLIAAKYLAQENVKTLIVERNIYGGGGFWQGGYLFPKTVVEAPAHEILAEMGIELEEAKPGLYVADSFIVVAKLLAHVAECGAKLLNSTYVDDIIYKDGRVSGVVVNWFPITQMPEFITCMDPIALESKVVIDATGHEANLAFRVKEIQDDIPQPSEYELQGAKANPEPSERKRQHKAMNVTEAERLVVEHTQEVYPGLVICGMACASFFRLPRMGPIFGGMLKSGKKAAEIALEVLGKKVPAGEDEE